MILEESLVGNPLVQIVWQRLQYRRMNALMHVAQDDQGDVIVLVDWEGFDAEDRTWDSLRKIHFSAPDFVLKELRKLRLTRALKDKLASEYGISL